MRNYQGILRRFAAAVAVILSLPFVAAAQQTNATLSMAGTPILALTVPAAAKITSTNGYLHIETTNLSLHIWADITNGWKVNDAVPRTAEIIKSEFVKFKAATTLDMTIAGSAAKHVIGSGNEADDNDPGNAEVVFFTVAGRVFVACVHGEADDASKARPAMMSVLQTVHATLEARMMQMRQ